MKTKLSPSIAASVTLALAALTAGHAFAAQDGAQTSQTPGMQPIPAHVDKPGDHPRGPADVKTNAAAGADNPQTPATRPITAHVDKPGDHPRGGQKVKPDATAGADNPQTPAHVDKPGMGAPKH